MKSLLAVTTLVVVLCGLVSSVDSAVTCSPKDEPILINTAVISPDFIVDFDVQIDLDKPSNILFAQDDFNVTLSGSAGCTIITVDFNLGQGGWISTEKWFPDNDTSPGPFLGLNEDSNGACEITFSEPIGHFSVRVAAQQGVDAGLFVLDEADEELNCNIFPWVTGLNSNSYSVRGFSAAKRNIKKIVFKDNYSVADLLYISRCPAGYRFQDSSCTLVDPCAVLPEPCGSNANCTAVDNTAQCTCISYYEGNATTGCMPVTCASGLCNENATCSELTSEPFVNCTCQNGFNGDGLGPRGCLAAPVSAPVTATPVSGSVPVTESPVSKATPKARVASASRTTGILSLFGLVCASVAWI